MSRIFPIKYRINSFQSSILVPEVCFYTPFISEVSSCSLPVTLSTSCGLILIKKRDKNKIQVSSSSLNSKLESLNATMTINNFYDLMWQFDKISADSTVGNKTFPWARWRHSCPFFAPKIPKIWKQNTLARAPWNLPLLVIGKIVPPILLCSGI